MFTISKKTLVTVSEIETEVDQAGWLSEEKLIAFASRSLASAEKQYSQLEKEALAIVFGVKHFHQYLYSRPLTILSDHKSLQ